MSKEDSDSNSSFPSSKSSHLQNEAKCKTFLVKICFICTRIKSHFHINSFALRLGQLENSLFTNECNVN